MQRVRVGDLSKDIVVVADGAIDDLTDVTDATIEVRKPDGTEVSWTAALSSQTEDTLTLTYTTDDTTSEFDLVGEWRIYASLEDTGTVIGRTDTNLLVVLPEYGVAHE